MATTALTRAVRDAQLAAPMWCLTQGAVRTPGDDRLARPAQAAVHGLGRVAALELAERWGGTVDLPEAVDDRALTCMLQVLAADWPRRESEVAVRANGLYGRRLVRANVAAGDWTPHGTVLVTGAATPIGARLTRWLAANGAAHLVLVGERPDDEAHAPLTDVKTTVVTDPADLGNVLETLPHPVTALVHAETQTAFGALTELDLDDFADILAAKTELLFAIDAALSGRQLEREIYCSSVAGVWGATSMAAYAAGSAYLDALAEHRSLTGRPCTAVAWSPWADTGAAVDQARLRERGLRALAGACAGGLETHSRRGQRHRSGVRCGLAGVHRGVRRHPAHGPVRRAGRAPGAGHRGHRPGGPGRRDGTYPTRPARRVARRGTP
ncbi:beta-ketoacyl reductase [Streptomyces noursei]|nr:beta-ketoacyl reductase [Streptomyces noursei]